MKKGVIPTNVPCFDSVSFFPSATLDIQETRYGKIEGGFKNGDVDVMQVNVDGDWSSSKASLGLTEGGSTSSAQQSIRAGIMFLYWKGIDVEKIKDANGKNTGFKSTWIGGSGWSNAVKAYNGNGDPKYMEKLMCHFAGLMYGMTDGAYKKALESEDNDGKYIPPIKN